MKTTLTRIHLGLGMSEIGVQFDVDDGHGGTVRQRAFVEIDSAAMAPVWAAAQAALVAKLGELPLDMPPGAVTTALMRQRTAEAARDAAVSQQREAEAAKAAREAESADLDEQIAEKRKELESLRAP